MDIKEFASQKKGLLIGGAVLLVGIIIAALVFFTNQPDAEDTPPGSNGDGPTEPGPVEITREPQTPTDEDDFESDEEEATEDENGDPAPDDEQASEDDPEGTEEEEDEGPADPHPDQPIHGDGDDTVQLEDVTDFPVYEGAEFIGQETPAEDRTSYQYNVDDVEAAIEFYEDALWSEGSDYTATMLDVTPNGQSLTSRFIGSDIDSESALRIYEDGIMEVVIFD